MHHIRLKDTKSNWTFISFDVEVNIRCSYQYVSFEEQTGLNGDTDAGLTVSLDITANIRQRNVLNMTNNTTQHTNSFLGRSYMSDQCMALYMYCTVTINFVVFVNVCVRLRQDVCVWITKKTFLKSQLHKCRIV